MNMIFLGVGEACDEKLPNTSVLVEIKAEGDKKRILLDCGFTIAHEFFKYVQDPDLLDGVWISHFHGDHFLGLPLLLLRFWEMGRKKPLTFVGQRGIEEVVTTSMKLAFPSLADKISFEYRFHEVEEMEEYFFLGLKWRGAYTGHTQPNLGLVLKGDSCSLYYSGDGPPMEKTFEMVDGPDIIIQESFLLDSDIYGHGNALADIEFCRKCRGKRLALVHMQRETRHVIEKYFEENMEKYRDVEIIIPMPGDKVTI